MRFLASVVILCLAAVALAQTGTDVPTEFTVNPETQPFGSSLCALDSKFKQIDKTGYYKAAYPGLKRICVKDYLDACATVNGIQPCNLFNSQCTEVSYDYADSRQHPNSTANMARRPEVCVDSQPYRHPDTAVVIIAQIIFSGIIMILAFVLFLLLVQGSFIFKILLGVFLVVCLLLTFSYYYLNAIIIFGAAIAAGICFSLRSDAAAGAGFAIILAVLFWTTFQQGLGGIQHQSRFGAGDATTDYYEQACNNYYRGYFFFPLELHKDDDNIAVNFRGFCNREWLAAELFFMIFAQQLLVVLIGAGAMEQFGEPRHGEVEYVATNEIPKQQQ
jgi:hypothetical protein